MDPLNSNARTTTLSREELALKVCEGFTDQQLETLSLKWYVEYTSKLRAHLSEMRSLLTRLHADAVYMAQSNGIEEDDSFAMTEEFLTQTKQLSGFPTNKPAENTTPVEFEMPANYRGSAMSKDEVMTMLDKAGIIYNPECFFHKDK